MTISEQVQNDYTVAWQVIGPMARQLSLGELFTLCLTSPSIRLWWASPLANESHTGKQVRETISCTSAR